MAKLGAYRGRLFVDFRFRGIRRREYLRLSDTAANRTRAQGFLKLLEGELALGTFDYARRFPSSRWARAHQLLPPDPPPAFGPFAREWLSDRRATLRPETATDYHAILEHYLVPTLGSLRIDEIHDGHVRRLIKTLREQLARLRTILGTARARGYLDRHPRAGIRSLPEPRRESDPLSPAEIRRFLAACPALARPYYRVAFGTGLRPSEQIALRKDALDFGRRTIRIRVARTRLGEHEPKTKRSDREISMLPDVAAALREQLARTATISPYVFATSQGTPVNHGNLSRRVWGPTLQRAGLRYRNPYQTRHTFASLALAAGEDPARGSPGCWAIGCRQSSSATRSTSETARAPTGRPSSACSARAGAARGQKKGRNGVKGKGRESDLLRNYPKKLERATGFEPATSSLGSWHSAPELRPPVASYSSTT